MCPVLARFRSAVGDDVSELDAAVPQTALAQLTWPAEAKRIPSLRAEVRGWLSPFGFSTETAEDIVLAVNEAVTNTIDHAYAAPGAGNTFDVILWTDSDVLHIAVVDRGRWRRREVPSPYRGLGIPMMKQLIDTVVIDRGPAGTCVTLRHRLPTAGPQRGQVAGSTDPDVGAPSHHPSVAPCNARNSSANPPDARPTVRALVSTRSAVGCRTG